MVIGILYINGNNIDLHASGYSSSFESTLYSTFNAVIPNGASKAISLIQNGQSGSFTANNRSVTVDKNGKVTIAAKFAGAATITITSSATKNCKTAKKNITVTVNPSGTSLTKCTNIKKRKADIRWKKNSYVTGYEIQYCTSKTFKSGVKKKVITKSSTTKYTAAGLASKKTYYVRIRTY